MRWYSLFIVLIAYSVYGQGKFVAIAHPNTGKYALGKEDSLITDYIFSEISEFSEGKAFASVGGLYAYIDTNGVPLCPYIFAVAGDFYDGYAVAGDSNFLGMINARMQVVVPFRFIRVLRPKMGLIRARSVHGLWGAYDLQGNIKLPFIYDLPPVYDDLERIIVVYKGLYGLVNDCNEIVFNPSYQYISREGLAYRSGKYLRIFNKH